MASNASVAISAQGAVGDGRFPALAQTVLDRIRIDPAHGRLIGLAASAAIGVMVCYALRNADLTLLTPILSGSILFWLAFAANYLHAPIADAAIFRLTWGPSRGLFGALVRKQIANALAVSYAGEAMLLHWAHGNGIRSFAAVKDSAILSALAGSVMTMLLVLPLWSPLSVSLGISPSTLMGSLVLLSAIPFAGLALRDRVFSLPSAILVQIAGIHMVRVIANIALVALCWHLLLPSEALHSWLLLSAARMVVARLPLLPNKDIALGGVAIVMFPNAPLVAGVVAATGLLFTVAHLCAWAGTTLVLKNRS